MLYQLKVAERTDLEKLTGFIERAGVSAEGLENLIDYFVMMEAGDGEVVACIGVEPVGDLGLLRSLVVSDKLKQAHILTLFQSIQTLAEQKGIQQLFLVTNKDASVQFLSLMGFEETDKGTVPAKLFSLEHMKASLEQVNAKIMVKSS